MGTKIEIAAFPDDGKPLREWARHFSDLLIPERSEDSVVVHLTRATAGSQPLIWVCVTNEKSDELGIHEDVALIASKLTSGPALHAWYSDIAGTSGGAEYRDGERIGATDSEVELDHPLTAPFLSAFDHAFPGHGIDDPDDLFDIWYGSGAISESYVVISGGVQLESPVPYVASAPEERGTLMAREFAWGKNPRSVVSGCTLVFGVVMTSMILMSLVWYIIEMMR